jgi:hypothetical protein
LYALDGGGHGVEVWRRMRRSIGFRRGFTGALVALAALALSGCNKHENVAVVHSCPLVVGKKIVVASDKGEIGMAKISLTPKELKADDCRS